MMTGNPPCSALGDALNAVQHVWGYFKDAADARRKADFLKGLDGSMRGNRSIAVLKRKLYALAEIYGMDFIACAVLLFLL